MIRGFYSKLRFWMSIQIRNYLYLNYFCKNIIRRGNGKIIPYKGAVIDLEIDSKIYIQNENLEIGTNKLKDSKTETYLRLRQGAVWMADGGCEIAYGSTIEILHNSKLKSGYFTMNSFSTLIAKEEIELGNDVMIARRAIIFDSDFHPIEYSGKKSEYTKKVKIGDHVWIGSNAMILKGVTIGERSIVSANTLVTKEVMEGTLVGNLENLSVLKKDVNWKR